MAVLSPMVQPLSSLPEYGVAGGGPILETSVAPITHRAVFLFEKGEVLLTKSDQTIAGTTQVALLPQAGPQAVQFARDGSGGLYMLVCSLDRSTGTSYLDKFTDVDGDGMLDQASRVTLLTESGAHFLSISMHSESGTTYVSDAVGNRVFRVADSDSDLVPDASGSSVFFGPGVLDIARVRVGGVRASDVRSVIVDAPDLARSRSRSAHLLSDTDEDGVADLASLRRLGESGVPEISQLTRVGLESVDVWLPDDQEYVLLAESRPSGVVEALSDEVSGKGWHSVALSRALSDSDVVVVRVSGESSDVARITPLAANVTHILPWVEGQIVEGQSLLVRGSGLTGSERVELVIEHATAPDEQWACTISEFSGNHLTVDVPDMQLSGVTRMTLKITPLVGPESRLQVLASPSTD